MTTLKKLALLLVAAGSVLSAHAQTDQSDADRRMRNREEIMARRQQVDREGEKSVPPAVVPMRQHRGAHHHHRHPHRHHAK
jgi:hypothetical protein